MKTRVKKQLIRRLKIVEGQIRGLQEMVEAGTYCVDVIAQSAAAKQALSSVEDLLLQNHLSTHVIEQMKAGKENKAIKEILAVYHLSKKK